jgi:CheY-like chemotaxis protein
MPVQPPKKILYAEDDVVTLTAYKRRLEQEGYEVQTAADGLEALKALHFYKPDLLLLDLMLPKFTGEEVLKFVTSHPSLGLTPVVVLSTNSILTAANEALLEKAGKRILKHECSFPKLIAAIEELLDDEKVAARAAARSQLRGVEEYQATGLDAAGNPIFEEIKDMQARAQVVCAWTDRINIEGKWLKLTEFLSEHLHMKITHGVSPEGRQQFLSGK